MRVKAVYLVGLGGIQSRTVNPFYGEAPLTVQRRVEQGFHHAQIGVVQLRVLPNQSDNRLVGNYEK